MREVIFRAWYEEGGYMMPVEEIDFNQGLINKTGIWRWFYEVKLMQYTGLDDKNGLGIFEKDIVKITVDDGFNYIDSVGFVDWHEKEREYAIFFGGEPWRRLSIEDEIEVIGDIYQNKEELEWLL